MSSTRVSMPLDAIRIEDEVWQDAFALAQDVAARRRRRMHAVDGGLSEPGLASEDVPRVRPASTGAVPAPVPAPMPADAATAAVAEVSPVAATAPAAQTFRAAATVAEARLAIARPGDGQPVGGRRTVTIRGYGGERNLPWIQTTRRRPQRPVYERASFRPDRLAMWAVLLGVLLLLVAIASAHS